jgi:hypothetical protein
LARKRNPEKARQIVRDYHIANVEKIRKQRAEHRAGNADRINAKIKEWRVAHPYYVKDRLASDIQFYLAKALRHRLYQALRAKGIRKSAKTLDLLGCTLAEFKVHIETQFYGGMSWDDMNFHLDHIKQVCTFDLTDPEQQKQCFHYTNIRPLTEDDNLRRPKRAA